MNMRMGLASAFAALVLGFSAPAVQADTYELDGTHASVSFKIAHAGVSWTHGRFNGIKGAFTVDPSPGKSSFEVTIAADSVDTNQPQRDEHLRSPDFFNVKQFPAITFKSTSVKPVEKGLEVTGDFTLHGVTKPITLVFEGGKTTEFPAGVARTGYTTQLVLKRTDFGVGKPNPGLGDEVYIDISFEGTRKK